MSDESDARPDDAAQTSADPRDRRSADRRSGRDRRAGTSPPPGVERRGGDRRQNDRRLGQPVPDQYRGNVRSINEYPLDPDELEFINAINAYKQRYARPFPTWSEVLHVLRFLGYRKVARTGAASGGDPALSDAPSAGGEPLADPDAR